VFAALFVLPLGWASAEAQEQDQMTDCRSETAQEIDKLGVKANVKEINYYVKWVGQNRSTGVNAWVALDNCRGDLVISFNRACEVQEAYGHGDCGRLIPTTYGQ
jgi:hypothetical protein